MSTPALRRLNEYRTAVNHFKNIVTRKQMLKDRLTSLPTYSDQTRVARSPTFNDQKAEIICELQSLEIEVVEAEAAAKDAYRYTKNAIFLVRGKQEGRWEQVLNLYYIKCLSWRQVAEKMQQPHSTIIRWRNNAVGVIDGVLLQYELELPVG